MKKLFLTWEDFDDGVYAALADIKASPLYGHLSGVYGVPRGGLPLAVSLSHHLGIPLLTAPQPRCLIVDDIIESGKTMTRVIAQLPPDQIKKQNFAAWVWVSKNPTVVRGYGRFEDPDVWVVFPWEDWQKAEKDYEDYVSSHEVQTEDL